MFIDNGQDIVLTEDEANVFMQHALGNVTENSYRESYQKQLDRIQLSITSDGFTATIPD